MQKKQKEKLKENNDVELCTNISKEATFKKNRIQIKKGQSKPYSALKANILDGHPPQKK